MLMVPSDDWGPPPKESVTTVTKLPDADTAM